MTDNMMMESSSENFHQQLLIDEEAFEQILMLDEDEEEHEFSKDLVMKYFDQAEATLKQLNEKIQERDLVGYSKLGHFLKGSSGQLGLARMQAICKSMQEISAGKSVETLNQDMNSLLQHAQFLLNQGLFAFNASKKHLMEFYKL